MKRYLVFAGYDGSSSSEECGWMAFQLDYDTLREIEDERVRAKAVFDKDPGIVTYDPRDWARMDWYQVVDTETLQWTWNATKRGLIDSNDNLLKPDFSSDNWLQSGRK